MDVQFDTYPEEMTTEQITASLRILQTSKKTLESELFKRLQAGETVIGYKLGLVKDYSR